MKRIVLVTAIGTVTATAIVKELKKTGNFYIIGTDINKKNEIATSLDTDEFYTFPAIADMDYYLSFVLNFCQEHKVEYYYAVLDKEVVKISEHKNDFAGVGTKLCVVDYDFAKLCHYKNIFSKWIENHMPEINIKTYCSFEDLCKASFPVFIKPVEGVASSGCKKINTLEELESEVIKENIGQSVIVQEYVSGQNITVDCIRNRKTKQKMQVQRKEILRNSNGCGIAVEIFHNEILAEICERVMDELDLNGVINIEFFDTGKGYRIIEINPRFSAGTLYTCMSGINTVLNAMYIADGQECVFGEPMIGAHYAERYETYQTE